MRFFYKTRYLNEEVNSADPFPSVSIPWFLFLAVMEQRKVQMLVAAIFAVKLRQ